MNTLQSIERTGRIVGWHRGKVAPHGMRDELESPQRVARQVARILIPARARTTGAQGL